MPGFQSLAARTLAQPPRRYADGGLVDDTAARMEQQRQARRQAGAAEAAQAQAWSDAEGERMAQQKLAEMPPQSYADGGPVGFGARGLAGLRDLVPKMAAMGYPQAAAPAPAPAADPRGAAGLRAMIPQVEAMGYKQASAPAPQYFARGGVVRGPGTGTSDSIEAEAEPGTFIMPADSTEAIGPSALEQMGTMPVRLSDGEFEMPPEQVMALGAAVLKLMKDATHTPVNGEDGGQTDAELAEPAGFAPDAAQRMAAPPEQRFADGGLVDPVRRPNSFGDAAAVAQDPGVTQVNTGGADTFGRAPASAPPPAAPAGFPSAASRMASTSDPTNPYAASNAAVMSNFANQQGSRGMMEMGRAPAPAPLAAPNSFGDAAAATVYPMTTQPRYTPGAPVPAATQLASVPTMPQPVGMAASARPATPAPAAAAPAAPMGWAERQAQRNAEVSAASITNRPEWSRAPAAQRLGQMPNAPAGLQPLSQRQPRSYADGGSVEDDRAVFGFYPQLRDNQRTTNVTGNKLAQGVQATPAGFQPAAPAAEPPLPPAAARMNNLTDPRSTEFAAASPAPVSTGPLGRAASMSPPAPQPAAQALASGITRDGDSYTGPAGIRGDVTINGGAPRNGGAVSGQNMAAADSLAGRASQESAARVLGQTPAGFQGAAVQPPTVLSSENSWQKRNDLRNALVSASSITANGGRFDRNKGESPESLTYRALLGNDMAAQGAAPRLAADAMEQTGANNRAALANRGAMDRTQMQEQGLNLRAVIEARRSGQPPAGYQWNGSGGLTHIPGGPADPSVRGNKAPLNDVQSKALQFGTRMQEATGIIDKMATAGVTQPGLIKRGADAVGLGGLANFTQSAEQQQVEQAQRDFINAVLRRESGAAIADTEFSNANKQYFIQPGDSAEVQAQKRRNREVATAGILAEVPDSEKRVGQVLSAANAKSQPGKPAGTGQVPEDVGALLKKYGG